MIGLPVSLLQARASTRLYSSAHMSRWESWYHNDPRIPMAPLSRCALDAAGRFQEARCRTVLDLGCGAGRDSGVLAESGAAVVGVDAARSGIRLAQQRTAAIRFLVADARLLPFAPQCFDGIYCYGLLHEFVGPNAAADVTMLMAEIRRVLRPGVILALAVLHGDPEQGLPHVRLFTPAMFADATRDFVCLEQQLVTDTGCTGHTDYTVVYGVLRAHGAHYAVSDRSMCRGV